MELVELVLSPQEAFDEPNLHSNLLIKSGLDGAEIQLRPVKRSIDARGKKVVVRFQAEVYGAGELPGLISWEPAFRLNHESPTALIIGSGPAGLFAAIRLLELGVKPVILERGSDVQTRRRDLAAINKHHVVNPESNYCFGEGGAGTYSDGKLYTRSKKRGDIRRVLEILYAHGGRPDILFDAHPHIGTNKLPALIAAMRKTILDAGGEIHFNCKLTDFDLKNGAIASITTDKGDKIDCEALILATGHSARDIYELLYRKGVYIEAKPFAIGIRAEHPQQLIDQVQYHCTTRDPALPASSYSLVHQASINGSNRGVFSFCMCPGGFIVPSATAPGEVVVNGMSPSRRDSRYANSGIVVAVDLGDFEPYKKHGPLAGLQFQREIEMKACSVAGNSQTAPGQRMVDFVTGKTSASLQETSYQPGLASVDLKEVLPPFISEALRQGFQGFGKKMRGYFTNEAVLVGVESRTSSPVRIPRDPEALCHPQIRNLFPCGEGPGFAGGIVSAAMDGERSAEALATFMKSVRL